MTDRNIWVFGFDEHYPLGGMDDLIGRFHSRDAALKYLQSKKITHKYYQIFDINSPDQDCEYLCLDDIKRKQK